MRRETGDVNEQRITRLQYVYIYDDALLGRHSRRKKNEIRILALLADDCDGVAPTVAPSGGDDGRRRRMVFREAARGAVLIPGRLRLTRTRRVALAGSAAVPCIR